MSDQINVNAIANTLQTKVDLPTGSSQSDVDFVIEKQEPNSSNNYTWYRKYKSGWVEQGGYGTAGTSYSGAIISLSIEMSDNTYSITLAVDNGENYAYPTTVRYSNRTTTSFNAIGNYNGGYGAYKFTWEVKGLSG